MQAWFILISLRSSYLKPDAPSFTIQLFWLVSFCIQCDRKFWKRTHSYTWNDRIYMFIMTIYIDIYMMTIYTHNDRKGIIKSYALTPLYNLLSCLHLSLSLCHVFTNDEKAEALKIQSMMKSKIVIGHQKFKLPSEVTTLWLYTIKWKYLLRIHSAVSDRKHIPDSLEVHALS